MNPIRFTLACGLLALGLAACGEAQGAPVVTPTDTPSASATPAPKSGLKIVVDLSYSKEVDHTVAVGTTVLFATATADQEQLTGDIHTPMFGQAGFAVTFGQPGTFRYRSSIHGGVHGVVTVR